MHTFFYSDSALKLRSIMLWLGMLGLFGMSLQAQKVERYTATEINGYGIVYTLPVTELRLTYVVRHEQFTPGQYAMYAQRFLGKKAEEEPRSQYSVLSPSLYTVGVPNPDKQYMVPFKPGKQEGYVYCTEQGILFSINGMNQTMLQEYKQLQQPLSLPDRESTEVAAPRLTEEYVQATTPLKRAEIAAAQLFELRETLLDLASGRVEQMPRDGQAMEIATQVLKQEIAAIEQLFYGYTTVTYSRQEARFTPYGAIQDYVWQRFSRYYGAVSPTDLSGAPIYLTLEVIHRAPVLSEEEQEKKEKKQKGVLYCVPGRIKATLRGTPLKEPIVQEFEIAQLGSVESLTPKIDLRRKTQTMVCFSPITGALLGVGEEDSPELME